MGSGLMFTVDAPEDREVVDIRLEGIELQAGDILEQVEHVFIKLRAAKLQAAIFNDEADQPLKFVV